jgi:hypothetical protein
LSVTSDRSMDFSGYSVYLNQYNWPPRYNWNIVENGIKYHNPLPLNEYVNKRLRYTNSISFSNINHWCLTVNSKTRISTQYTYDVHPYNWTRPMIPCNRGNQGGVPCSKATCEIYSLISLYRLLQCGLWEIQICLLTSLTPNIKMKS